MSHIKVGLVSYKFINNNIKFNISQIKKAITLSKGSVDMLCFGETFLQGFDSLNWHYENDKDIAITQLSETMELLKALSLENKIDFLFGYIERDGGYLYSSCAVIVNGEIMHNYRRITKNWKEYKITDEHYKEGDTVKSFFYKGKEITLTLCGDLWIYPEKFRTKGIVIWPVYVNFSIDEWQTQQYEYAKQSLLASTDVLMINSISENPDSHGGAFYFKNGTIKQKLDFRQEGILIVELS